MKIELIQLVIQVQIDGTLIVVERMADGTLNVEGMFTVSTEDERKLAARIYTSAERNIKEGIAS